MSLILVKELYNNINAAQYLMVRVIFFPSFFFSCEVDSILELQNENKFGKP